MHNIATVCSNQLNIDQYSSTCPMYWFKSLNGDLSDLKKIAGISTKVDWPI
jgi:hypothetical protein